MKIGFTGTRFGMTQSQRAIVMDLIAELEITEAHHGDCVGADAQFHKAAEQIKARLVVHPPVDESHRARCWPWDEVRPVKTHFARNRDIVDESDVLIGTPFDATEQPKGGTWYTINYARKRGKRLFIVWPDGSVREESAKVLEPQP